MSERIRTQKRSTSGRAATESTVEVQPVTDNEATAKLKAELDDLLDEIDGVLETNAEEFVKSYIQKGGE